MRGKLPAFVDFGSVPLLRRAERPLTIFNEGIAPVDYRVSFLKPHDEFDVEPKSGAVAPSSKVTFTLSYAPMTMTTGVCEILVATSLPGLPPARISLSGSCVPGAVRDATLHVQQLHLAEGAARSQGSILPRLDGTFAPSVNTDASLDEFPMQSHPPSSESPSPPSAGGYGDQDAEPLLLRRGRGARYSRADPGQLLLEERLTAYKSAQVWQ